MNLKRLFSKVLKKTGLHPKYKKSYSQCGEDLIIRFIFDVLKIKNPTYIDVGANHPFMLNNTYLFYKNGCSGINIEPNSFLIKKLKKYRKKDINLNIGVSDEEGILEFYNFEYHTMSTFSKEEANKLQNEHGFKLESIDKIKVDTLQNIIEEYCNGIFPDLLSIDVEGLDEQILKSIQFEKSAPTIIVAETCDFSMVYKEDLKRMEIMNILKAKDYIVYADTMLNTIFVRKEKLMLPS
jgi:FkbM family methyltransferase